MSFIGQKFDCKYETCLTGMEQLRLGFGLTEESEWLDKFSSVFSKQQVRRIQLLDLLDDLRQKKNEFEEIFGQVSVLLNDDVTMYSILMLLILTQTDGTLDSFVTQPLVILHSTYWVVLKRRLISRGDDDWSEIMTQVCKSLFHLEKFSNILKQVKS